MNNLVELAIEREEQRLDAALEVPEDFDRSLFPWHNSEFGWSPTTRKFAARVTPTRRFSTRPSMARSH